jgi:hypothetical protein
MARVCVFSGAALALLLLAQPALATGRDSSYSPAAQRQATLYLGGLGAAPAFNKDDVISDVNFSDIYCLSQAAVQSFLAAQPGILDTYKTADHRGVKRSAAAVIWRAAQAWRVSPRVILATLQKEQGLLSATSPSTSALDWAMGCGVPDSGGRNSTYQGFGRQVWFGAQSLHDDGQGWHAGISKTCGDGPVEPADRSTYALYIYTPWIGLAGGGNKLFWTLYRQYFGDPLAVDRIAPTTTVQRVDRLWHARPVTLRFRAADNRGGTGVVKTQYSLDGGPWTKGSSLTVAAPRDHSGDGLHSVAYRSIDYAGNVEPADRCRVKIDTTPPATTVSGETGRWRNHAVSLSFTASDKGSGMAFSKVKLDRGPWRKATTLKIPAPADHSGDGSHTISYRSTDKVGNLEQTRSCRVMIDTSPPRPMASWAATAVRGKTASLRYFIADRRPGSPSATVTIRVRTLAGRLVRKLVERDVAVNRRLVATFTCRLARGHYRFFVYATDAAGNRQTMVASNGLRVR